MGNTHEKKFKVDSKVKKEKREYVIKAKIRDLNSLTLKNKFRLKTGYLINFSYNETSIDKLFNILSTETLIRAEVVNIIIYTRII